MYIIEIYNLIREATARNLGERHYSIVTYMIPTPAPNFGIPDPAQATELCKTLAVAGVRRQAIGRYVNPSRAAWGENGARIGQLPAHIGQLEVMPLR
jgi:hypothetical protein